MAKRMILTLAVAAAFVAALGFVVSAGQATMAAAFQPPPEAVTTIVPAGALAGHAQRDRHSAAVRGVT